MCPNNIQPDAATRLQRQLGRALAPSAFGFGLGRGRRPLRPDALQQHARRFVVRVPRRELPGERLSQNGLSRSNAASWWAGKSPRLGGPALICQRELERFDERRQVTIGCAPDFVNVDVSVVVDEFVPHADDLWPWNIEQRSTSIDVDRQRPVAPPLRLPG